MWNSLRVGVGGGEADAVNGTVFGLFLAQGENFTARDNTFVGYKYPGKPEDYPNSGMVATAALSTCNHCDFPNTKCNGAKTSVVSGSTWVDTTARLKWGKPYKAIIEDVDGSLTGAAAGTTVVPDWPHLRGGCAAAADAADAASGLAATVPLGSLLCPAAAKAFRFAAHKQSPYASFVERPLLL